MSCLRIVGGGLEDLLSAPDHLRAEGRRRPLERSLQRWPCLVRRAHDRVRAQLDALEAHLAPPPGHVQGLQLMHRHALGLSLDKEKGESVLTFATTARR